jgi:2-dehydropantoate 2-reductase
MAHSSAGNSNVSTRLLIVGNGRVAQSLRYFSFDHNQIAIHQWYRTLGVGFDTCLATVRPTHIVFAISDHAIEPFVEEYSIHIAQLACVLVHCAGRFGCISVASSLKIYPAHPLMSFAGALVHNPHSIDRRAFDAISFVVSAEGKPLQELLPTLPNRSIALHDYHRAYYHALCTLAVSATVLAWETVESAFSGTLDIPSDILLPYRSQIMENLAQRTADKTVLTGAIARHDHITMKEHLDALQSNHHEALAELYRACMRLFDHQSR